MRYRNVTLVAVLSLAFLAGCLGGSKQSQQAAPGAVNSSAPAGGGSIQVIYFGSPG